MEAEIAEEIEEGGSHCAVPIGGVQPVATSEAVGAVVTTPVVWRMGGEPRKRRNEPTDAWRVLLILRHTVLGDV